MKKKHKPQPGAFGNSRPRDSHTLTVERDTIMKKLKPKKSLKAPKRLMPG